MEAKTLPEETFKPIYVSHLFYKLMFKEVTVVRSSYSILPIYSNLDQLGAFSFSSN